jgi:hypothetical protein
MERLANSMQFFNSNKCKKPHWIVVEGKLILETANEKHQELAKQVITVLEAQIRNEIAKEILAWNPVANRKEIVKRSGSIDNALIGVQAICADIALGNQKEQNGTE